MAMSTLGTFISKWHDRADILFAFNRQVPPSAAPPTVNLSKRAWRARDQKFWQMCSERESETGYMHNIFFNHEVRELRKDGCIGRQKCTAANKKELENTW